MNKMTPDEAEAYADRIAKLLDKVCDCGSAYKSARFYWPGSEDKPVECCGRCAARARRIAEVMGFELRVESTLTGNEEFGGSRTRLLEVDK